MAKPAVNDSLQTQVLIHQDAKSNAMHDALNKKMYGSKNLQKVTELFHQAQLAGPSESIKSERQEMSEAEIKDMQEKAGLTEKF